jgi:hypothetical protein
VACVDCVWHCATGACQLCLALERVDCVWHWSMSIVFGIVEPADCVCGAMEPMIADCLCAELINADWVWS